MQKYPEVYSLEKSLAILEKYKDELSVENNTSKIDLSSATTR